MDAAIYSLCYHAEAASETPPDLDEGPLRFCTCKVAGARREVPSWGRCLLVAVLLESRPVLRSKCSGAKATCRAREQGELSMERLIGVSHDRQHGRHH